MKQQLTDFQKNMCIKCEWREKILENVVMCPFPRSCPKMKQYQSKQQNEQKERTS